MFPVSCEEFERSYADWTKGLIEPHRRTVLDNHHASCSACRQFSPEAFRLRAVMGSMPKLDVSPQFAANLRRAIRQLEHPEARPDWAFVPKPYPLALSAGFATALLLGFLLLHPNQQPEMMLASPGSVSANPSLTATSQPAPQRMQSRPVSPGAHSEVYASDATELDTARHNLPEAPGKDSIPIPADDDLWRLNQASTTRSP